MKKSKGIAWLYDQIPFLIKEGILSNATADKIREYYGPVNTRSKMNIALAILGIVGTICVGLGIILIFAYNWDEFSRFQRTLLAFAPMVLSLAMLCWALSKKKETLAVQEGFSAFNMLSVGGAIALISQIYNIPGDISSFLLTWMLLSLPLVYLFESSLVAIFYLIGVTTWAGLSQASGGNALLFWPLVGMIFPHYFYFIKQDTYSSRTVWISSAICLSFTVGIGIALEKTVPGLWIIVYSSYFAILYLIGKFWFDDAPAAWQRIYKRYGVLGSVVVAYMLTYKWPWHDIGYRYYRLGWRYQQAAGIGDYVVTIVLVIIAVALLVRAFREKKYSETALGILPILSILGYSFSGFEGNQFIAMSIFNIYVLSLGIIWIFTGIKDKQLGVMNGGVLLTGVLIFTRFVDSSVGIIQRALIFIVIGMFFIVSNMKLAKRLQKEEVQS